MNPGEHGSSCFSVRTLKHVFIAIVLLSLLSILVLKVKSRLPINIHLNQETGAIMAMNRSTKINLIQSYLRKEKFGEVGTAAASNPLPTLLRSTAKPLPAPEKQTTIPAATTRRVTVRLPTTVSPTSIEPALAKAYNLLYEGSQPAKPQADKESCPAIPSNLIGEIKVYEQSFPINQLNSLNFRVEAGGTYTPPDCNPSQKVAIVIPFRNRDRHLAMLLLNLHPLLQKQQRAYTIFIVNQVEGSKFNRAMLMNVGFMEAMKKDKYTCVIFHDVDLLPQNDKNIYMCPEDNPRHMSAYIDKFGYKLPYVDILGGIVAVNSRLLVEVNGYSNQFFGWGGEDDDFSARFRRKGHKIVRYPQNVGRYKMIRHGKDSGNEPNPRRFEMLKYTGRRQAIDGLNTITYDIQSIQRLPLYTKLNVLVNQRAVMNASPHPLPAFLSHLS